MFKLFYNRVINTYQRITFYVIKKWPGNRYFLSLIDEEELKKHYQTRKWLLTKKRSCWSNIKLKFNNLNILSKLMNDDNPNYKSVDPIYNWWQSDLQKTTSNLPKLLIRSTKSEIRPTKVYIRPTIDDHQTYSGDHPTYKKSVNPT